MNTATAKQKAQPAPPVKPNGNGTSVSANRMNLESISHEIVKCPPRTLLYGIDGIGKSTFGANSKKPIFICCEDGATRLDVPKFPLCQNWQDVFGCLIPLGQEKHDYQTLVIDSIDWGQALAIQHCIKNEFEGDVASFEAYGKGYKSVLQEMRKLLAFMDRLHKVKQMEVLLIAHAAVKTFQNPNGDNYDRYQSNLIDSPNTSIWGLVKEWCDIVLFANFQVMIRKANKKAAKGKGVLVDGEHGSRLCHAAPSAAWDAKVRAGWNLPSVFALKYDVFDSYVRGEKEVETETETETEEAVI